MSFFTSIKKKTTLAAATNQISKARKAKDGKAQQLYKTAYEGFESVLSDNSMIADALYNWGFGLLNQAKSQQGEAAIALYEEAINKYSFCLTVEPYYLGAAVEGGVAYMDIARLKEATPDDDLYNRARKCFERAGEIQRGSGAFNLACIYSTANNHEACLASLKEAKEFGHLPDEGDILNDPDMKNITDTPWFHEFMDNIKAEKANAAAEKKAEKERKKAKADSKAGIVRDSEDDEKTKSETPAVETSEQEASATETKTAETSESEAPVAETKIVESSEPEAPVIETQATETVAEPETTAVATEAVESTDSEPSTDSNNEDESKEKEEAKSDSTPS